MAEVEGGRSKAVGVEISLEEVKWSGCRLKGENRCG